MNLLNLSIIERAFNKTIIYDNKSPHETQSRCYNIEFVNQYFL